MAVLISIPALGCDAGLHEPVNDLLPAACAVETHIADADDLAACVTAIIAGTHEPFVVMGTSFGGRVALEAALAAPDKVRGLIIIGAGAGPSADPAAGFRRGMRLRNGELEQVAAEMGAIIPHLPGPNGPAAREAFIAMMRKQGAELIARQSDALAKRGDLWPRLAEIRCPALMLWGRQDQFSPVSDGERMARAIPKGQFAVIEDCGHFPSLEYPEQTAGIIRRWMDAHQLLNGP